MLTEISHEALLESLLTLQPLELKSVKLHRAYKQENVMPDQDELGAAVRQLQNYGETCRQLAIKVRAMSPVPALDSNLVEGFSL